jgi:hypothetical protein
MWCIALLVLQRNYLGKIKQVFSNSYLFASIILYFVSYFLVKIDKIFFLPLVLELWMGLRLTSIKGKEK